MKSSGKFLIVFAFVSIMTNVTYAQERISSDYAAYLFRLWGTGTDGSLERALYKWDKNETILESKNPVKINFNNQSIFTSGSFIFDTDYGFNINKMLNNNYGTFYIGPETSNDHFWLGTKSVHILTIKAGSKGLVNFFPDKCTVFYKDGDSADIINISTANRARYALFVEGGILSEDFALGPKSSWADFVFEKDYQLAPLSEVETYIMENKRLPEMPSAREVQQDGYCLHDMNVKLLQKVEELTLYLIEQGKEVNDLKAILKNNNIRINVKD